MYKPEFIAALAQVSGGVKLLAIDEAHCITKWGHDLRPAYQEVGQFRATLGSPTTLALTATATPVVREDIRRTLGLDEKAMPRNDATSRGSYTWSSWPSARTSGPTCSTTSSSAKSPRSRRQHFARSRGVFQVSLPFLTLI